MTSAAETIAASICNALSGVGSIDAVERDRVAAVDKDEGITAVVELSSESFSPLGGNIYGAAVQQSDAEVLVHLMCWSATWQATLDAVCCDAHAAVMGLRSTVDHLRLTRRDWHPRQADTSFGSVTLAYSFTAVCDSADLSANY